MNILDIFNTYKVEQKRTEEERLQLAKDSHRKFGYQQCFIDIQHIMIDMEDKHADAINPH